MSKQSQIQSRLLSTQPLPGVQVSDAHRLTALECCSTDIAPDLASRRCTEATRMSYRSGKTYVVKIENTLCSKGFFDRACYKFYEVRLLNRARPLNTQLHAYCLLPDSIHLMVTPMTPSGLHELLDSLNKSYSDYFNLRFQRGRRVWQERPRLHPLPDTAICLELQKYIERLPVDQAGHSHPGTHPWTSYSRYAFDRCNIHLTMHPRFQRFSKMGPNPMQRYRDFIAKSFNEHYRQSLQGIFLA